MTVRILVVDDSRSSRKRIINHLPRTLHFDVTEASDSQEAMTLLNFAEFELLLLNLTASHIDNVRVLNAVTYSLCQPRIVVSYAKVKPEHSCQSINIEAVTFIQLPLDRDKIEMMLTDMGFL